MPLINYFYNVIKGAIVKHIIDIPEIPVEKKKEIAEKGAKFVKDLIVEAAGEVARETAKELKEKK
jgi:hypothetical protein